MESKVFTTALKGYFVAVAALMYYFLTETVNLGVFVTYRHVFALLLSASAVVCFLCKPNIARGAATVQATFIYCMPMLVTFVVSLFIWFMGHVNIDVIFRGMSGQLFYSNMLSFTLAAVAFLYIFGEKGIWYNLLAILISNILTICTVIAQNGVGVFFSEFFHLVITFAGETGEVIVQAEIHELAFCLGAYLIYMILKPRKNTVFFILLGLSVFCFLAAFKRIGIIALAVALFVGFLLKIIAKFKKSTAQNFAVVLSVCLVILLIGYIAIIKMGVFTMLEEAGVDTSGRMDIYNAVDRYYEFSPDFLGNGIGFLTYQLSMNMQLGVSSVHNDFLQYFIDLGFWGYILWLVSMTLVRVCYFGKNGKTDNAIIALTLTVYLLIVSSTDNTVNYPLLTTVLAVIMIGHGFDDDVRIKEQKIFGYISKANRETKGDALL